MRDHGDSLLSIFIICREVDEMVGLIRGEMMAWDKTGPSGVAVTTEFRHALVSGGPSLSQGEPARPAGSFQQDVL